MAELIFNHFATNMRAISAGTNPADEADPRISEILEEIEIPDAKPSTPKKITDEMLEDADHIISFGCLTPAMFPLGKFEEWKLDDPQTDEELQETRDELVKRIKGLIGRLES